MRLLLLLLSMACSLPLSAAPNWRLFYIHTFSPEMLRGNLAARHSGQYYRSCTATMLNVDGQCRLVTNAHCFPGNEGGAVLMMNPTINFPEHLYDPEALTNASTRSSYDFFTTSVDRQMVVGSARLLKRFVSKDLAELAVGEELRQQYCADLRPIDPRAWRNLGRERASYAALGFFMATATATFTNDRPWRSGRDRITLEPFASSLNLREFFRAHTLTAYQGMSGGLIIDGRERPVGIIARHVPYQEETFLIGMGEVVRFLGEAQEPTPPHPEIFGLGNHLNFHSNNDRPTGENDHGNGGENDHGNGGENDHGNGGENDHGNGAGTRARAASLSLLRLPAEGVVDPRNPRQIILARCGRQIDGYADYIATLGCQGPVVTRPVDGLPSDSVRRGLAERLLGNFQGRILRGNTSRLYYFDASSIGQSGAWRKIARGPVRSLLQVRGNELRFYKQSRDFNFIFNWERIPDWDHGFNLTLLPLPDGRLQVWARYHLQTPLPGGRTRMRLENAQLSCDDRNHLKLICHDRQGNFEFSLSKKAADATKLEYRIAYRTGVNVSNHPGFALIDYFYGELDVNDQGRPSAIPEGDLALFGL